MRETRDATLAVPNLILPSLQMTIRAGALPPRGRLALHRRRRPPVADRIVHMDVVETLGAASVAPAHHDHPAVHHAHVGSAARRRRPAH